MELQGRIKFIGDILTIGSQGFRKREMVVTTDEQYPQHIMIEFTQDKCDLLNTYQVGEPVKVSINLRGREWVNPQGETKYFNSIQGWRIERGSSNEQPAQQHAGYANQGNVETNNASSSDGGHDDLPF